MNLLKTRLTFAVTVVGALAVLTPLAPGLAGRQVAQRPGIASLTEPGEGLVVRGTGASGHATFASSSGRGIQLDIAADASAAERAASFVDLYGAQFGLRNRTQLAAEQPARRDELGIEHVRFQQVHLGVPITGAEFIVHLRGTRVVAANGIVLEDLPADVTPLVGPAAAVATATALVAKLQPDQASGARYSVPRLEVFNRGLLERRSTPTALAWFIEAQNVALRERIWIDARTGVLLLNFSQVVDARDRAIFTAGHSTTLPGTLVRSEGGGLTGDADQTFAYDFTGLTYDFFFTRFGRDSFNNAGATIVSTTQYSTSFKNAFWNGVQLVFGDGYASADDVVAHEWTHALTDSTARLFNHMESGALNESFSDIFGETIDLTDGVGNDAASVRWLVGEDLPFTFGSNGAVRNMMTPSQFQGAAKISDVTCDAEDNGRVHRNAGVLDHAYALMVDGGTFNFHAVTGIGLDRASAVMYRALTTYLTSGSGYREASEAITQACSDLIGTNGIGEFECGEVERALDAVQLSSPTPCSIPQAIPERCVTGEAPAEVAFSDDFESGLGNWTSSAPAFWALTSESARGLMSAHGADIDGVSDIRLSMSADVTIPPSGRMFFQHLFDFQNFFSSFDGGVVEFSSDGGAVWNDAGNLIEAGQAYGGNLFGTGNPLLGRPGFTRSSRGWHATRMNLASLAGQSVRFRFRIASDQGVGGLGWYVDNVSIYRCGTSCWYTLSASTMVVPQPGGAVTVNVTPSSGSCAWSATSNVSWITITGGQRGTGNGQVSFAVGPTFSAFETRTGTLTIAGQTFTVVQATLPIVTQQPLNRSTAPGGSTSFVAAAVGRPTPTLQWQVSTDNGAIWSNLANGGVYAGVTTTVLTLTGVTAPFHGNQYRVVATNVGGSTPSNAASLSVLAPGPAAACSSESPTYTFADGFESAAYQIWQGPASLDFTGWARTTSSAQRGIYSAFGQTVGNTNAALFARSLSVPAGGYLYFDHAYQFGPALTTGGVVEYSPDGGLTWFDMAGLIDSGAAATGLLQSATVPFVPVPAFVGNSTGFVGTRMNLAGLVGQSIRVRFRFAGSVSPGAGKWWVDNFAVYLCSTTPQSPFVSAQPRSHTMTTTDTAAFSVVVSGNPAPSYQWQMSTDGTNWSDLSNIAPYAGVATPDLTIAMPSTTLSGGQYRVLVTNTEGSGTSAPIVLSVLPVGGPVLTVQPMSNGLQDHLSLRVDVSPSTVVPTYQWERSTDFGITWSPVTSLPVPPIVPNVLKIAQPSAAQDGHLYRAIVENGLGSVTSDIAKLNVDQPGGQLLFANGSFSNGVAPWKFWEEPDMVWNQVQFQLGVQFYKANPTTTASGQAAIFQESGQPVAADKMVVAKFNLTNTSGVRKRISVLLLDSDFSDLSVCTFWLPPNSDERTYQMRTHPTKAWTNAAIYFYAATGGYDGGKYVLNNVFVQEDPNVPAGRTDCIDPLVPAPFAGSPGANLLTNGDFSAGMAGWFTFGALTSQVTAGVVEFVRPAAPAGTPAGVVFQPSGATMPANQLLTATFQLGNSSSVRKRVTVLIHDIDFTDLTACTYWLAPGQLLSTYQMRGYTTRPWNNATLSVYAATVGTEPWIQLDNATLARTPGAATSGTSCGEPPAPGAPIGGRGGGGGGGGGRGQSVGPGPFAGPKIPAGLGTLPGEDRRLDVDAWSPTPGFVSSDAGGRIEGERVWRAAAVETGSQFLLWPAAIDLTGVADARVVFDSWLSPGLSSGLLEASLDGDAWTTLAVVPRNGGWVTASGDLLQFADRPVFIRFRFDGVSSLDPDAPDVWMIAHVRVLTTPHR